MPCARCSMCALNFPIELSETECPACAIEILAGVANEGPHDPDDLHKAVTTAQFERFLEKSGRA